MAQPGGRQLLMSQSFFGTLNAIQQLNLSADIAHAQQSRQVADPYHVEPPKYHLQRRVWLAVALMPFVSLALLAVCLYVDEAIGGYGGRFIFSDMLWQMLNPAVDPDHGVKRILMPMLVQMSFSYGVLLSVLGISIDLASDKFTGQVASLFVADKKVVAVVAFVVTSNIVMFFLLGAMGEFYRPRAAVVIAVFVVVAQLVGLFPFTIYMFMFMDADRVIGKIVQRGLAPVQQCAADAAAAAEKAGRQHDSAFEKPLRQFRASAGDLYGASASAAALRIDEWTPEQQFETELQQSAALSAVEHLMFTAFKAVQQKDRIINAKAIDALCSYGLHYGRLKHALFAKWHEIPPWMRHSSDFLALSDEAISTMNDQQTFMEWKLLRQYLTVFGIGLTHLKDACYHIAMNTRLMGEAAGGERGDRHTLDLVLKFFNSYLRMAINVGQPAVYTVYIVLFQYKRLAEQLLRSAAQMRAERRDLQLAAVLDRRAVKIAKYMRYYGWACLTSGLVFLVEVIAHDIRSICELSVRLERCSVETDLLDVFLTLYDGSENGTALANLGVRRAQVSLATAYLVAERPELARRIYNEMAEETPTRLEAVYNELMSLNNKEFHEVTDRGINFTFLSSEQKQQLPVFLMWFEAFDLGAAEKARSSDKSDKRSIASRLE